MELTSGVKQPQMLQILKYGNTLWVFLELIICGLINLGIENHAA